MLRNVLRASGSVTLAPGALQIGLFLVALYFCPVVSSSFFFFSSPNLSRRRLDVCHTSTHDVALVRI